MIQLLVFAVPLAFFLRFPSTLWNFDGVACAAAVELGNPAFLFHANHLLYGFLGYVFWHTIGMAVGLSRALPALQFFTSLLSAAGLIGLYTLFYPMTKSKPVTFLLTLSLAFTSAFWVWSVEAQVYTLGFLALSWATFFLLAYPSPSKYILAGLFHGLAVLGHIMHVLWIIPALFWIRRSPMATRSSFLRYLLPLALTTVIPYLIVLLFVIAPSRDLAHVLIWLKGSAGLTPDRHWAWHSVGWTGPWVWLSSTLPTLWGSFLPYGQLWVSPWIWASTALSMSLLGLLIIRSWTYRKEPLALFAWLWLLVYGLFLSTWEPSTLCYRITDIIPIGILITLGLRRWKPPVQGAVVLLLVLSVVTVNMTTRILPMSHAEQNQMYQETLTLSRITSENSLYVTGGGLTWIYLLYFTGRTAWNGRSLEPQALRDELVRQKAKRAVYVQSSLLRDPQGQDALKTLSLRQLSEGSEWLRIN